MLDLDAIRATAKRHTAAQAAPPHNIQAEIEAPTEAPAPELTPLSEGGEAATTTAPPRPIPWHHLSADWRKAYAAWNAHRDSCPKCRSSERTAASAGAGIRCAEGQRLHAAYEAALD